MRKRKIEAGNYAGAKTSYLQVLQYEPNNYEILTKLGNLLLLEDRKAEAVRYFAEALKQKADYWPAREGLKKALK